MSRKEKIVIGTLVVAAAAIHLFLLGKYAVNLPFKDDYRVFVNYLYYFFNSGEGLSLIFLPDNESHPVLMRLITLLQYTLDGQLDFRHILWFCNLFLLLILVTLSAHFYRRKEYWNIAFVFLLVLNTMHHELYFRTDVVTYQTLSFSLSLFLFYGAVYYNSLGRWIRALFYIAFILTPFGSVNGMLANGLVVVYFLVNRENRNALVTTAVLLALEILFIVVFLSGDGKSLSVWENIRKYNFELVYAYFLAMGGVMNVISNPTTWTLLVGVSAVIFGYTFYRLFFPFQWRLDFEKLLFIFCAGSLALIVILRYNYWMAGYVSVLESRYKIYGTLIILLFFSVLVRRFSRIRPLVGLFLLGLFAAGVYKGTGMLKIQHTDQWVKAYNVDQDIYEQGYARDLYISKERKEKLEEQGIYSFEPVRKMAGRILVEKNRLKEISGVSIGNAETDPLSKGDWSKNVYPIQRLEADGVFPYKKYYFIRFRAKEGKSSLHPMGPPPHSVLKGLPPETVQELSMDFYPQVLTGVDFKEYEVYGTDDLGL
ncbi:MAG: hypothetical protein KF870_11970 [Leadbetterella sp.]|nr:hypothetical protein [Leadbetterella sp.]